MEIKQLLLGYVAAYLFVAADTGIGCIEYRILEYNSTTTNRTSYVSIGTHLNIETYIWIVHSLTAVN